MPRAARSLVEAARALWRALSARTVRGVLGVLASGVLAALLVATIHLTGADRQWIAFLGGVLIAGVLALASQTSRAHWLVARRTRQLERARAALAQEQARARNTAEALRIADARLRLLSEAVSTPIVFVDRNERCFHHNRAFQAKAGLPAEGIEGRPLREVLPSDVYLVMKPYAARALAGEPVEYELAWETPGSSDPIYAVRHVPYPPGDPHALGFYLLLGPAAAPPQRAEVADDAAGAARDGGQALYVRTLASELLGSEEPRERIARALENDEFLLFAQRIEPLAPQGLEPLFEVLLRLREEEDNLLPPGGFLPVAERYGMMEALDRWVVRNVLARSSRLRAQALGRAPPLYCVNLSPAAVESAEFARYVLQELERSGVPGGSLCFEIGETDVSARRDAVAQLLRALAPAGCRFTVDAFGSTRVSFSQLKGLRFDFVKIDGAIVQHLRRDPAALAKARAIQTVCRRLGVRTIAEFVEDEETLARLRAIGIDYAQGFGIARPGPIEEVA